MKNKWLLRTPEMKSFLFRSLAVMLILFFITILFLFFFKSLTWLLISLYAAGVITILTMGYISLKNNLTKARKASEFADNAMQPGFKGALPEVSEGIYHTLNHNINMLVKRQLATSENLTKEKEFLKNLVSDISHQMKTPLSTLILNNELLIKKYPDNELLELSRGQLDRMEVLVINLLKYARLEADSVIFTPDRDDIVLTVNNSIRAVDAAAKIHGISIHFAPGRSMKLNHDGSWLEEALINILKNAVEHTPDNENITISLSSTGISDNLVIEDTGPGIPEKDLPHIFDRFYKGNTGTNPSSIGIGLSLSRLIIEGLGGTVRAENIPSAGARFTISFPRF